MALTVVPARMPAHSETPVRKHACTRIRTCAWPSVCAHAWCRRVWVCRCVRASKSAHVQEIRARVGHCCTAHTEAAPASLPGLCAGCVLLCPGLCPLPRLCTGCAGLQEPPAPAPGGGWGADLLERSKQVRGRGVGTWAGDMVEGPEGAGTERNERELDGRVVVVGAWSWYGRGVALCRGQLAGGNAGGLIVTCALAHAGAPVLPRAQNMSKRMRMLP